MLNMYNIRLDYLFLLHTIAVPNNLVNYSCIFNYVIKSKNTYFTCI